MTSDTGNEKSSGCRYVEFEVNGRKGCIVEPTGKTDGKKRWVWFSPGWMPCGTIPKKNRKGGTAEHRYYVRRTLERGFCVVGVDCMVSCGSPKAIETYERTYEKITGEYGLNPKVRMFGQSNGGIMVYNWAVRHPDSVDRILGIYPATDLRSWPGLEKACDAEFTHGNGYDMTPAELEARLGEFNPIEQLEPLAKAGVSILHLHGDEDETVPMEPNSVEFARRYRSFGGEIELVVMKGSGHQREPVFYESDRYAEFLLD